MKRKIIYLMDKSKKQSCCYTILKSCEKLELLLVYSINEIVEMLDSLIIPHIIVVDIPSIAEELLKFIKNDERYNTIPVIIAVNESDNCPVNKLIDMGAEDIFYLFYCKPKHSQIVIKRVLNIIDAQELKKAEKELKKKTLLLEQLDTFIVEYNFKTGDLYIDPVKEKYISVPWTKDSIVPYSDYRNIVFRPDIPSAKQFLDFSDVDLQTRKRSLTLRLFTAPHRYEWFRVSQICFFDNDGNKEKVVVLFTNTDKKTEMEQSLKFHSEKDILTHLPNINAFSEKVMELIQNNPRDKYEVIRMDIEKFRAFNEVFGGKEGDNLLKFVAVKIQECLDEEDEVAYCRIASDIFAICVPIKYYSVHNIIEYLQKAVSAYPNNFEIILSFGIYLVTQEDKVNMISVSTFLDRAAAAQSTIKGNYLQHVATYNEKIEKEEKKEFMISSEMQSALEEKQFEIFLQPQVEMLTGKVVGAEALIRWRHPEKGIILPEEFIPIFERNGFIVEIDEFVIRNVCKLIRKWIDKGIEVYPISVNLSRANLYSPSLLQSIEGYIEKYQVPRNLLKFELTESEFIIDNSHMSKLADKLQNAEFCVMLDDFGGGYSSLNTLKDISVNVLKIDLKFLPADIDDEKAELILNYVVEMAKNLGLDILIEGVETIKQAEVLIKMGCKKAQGFYFYEPMPIYMYEKEMKNKPRSFEERKKSNSNVK